MRFKKQFTVVVTVDDPIGFAADSGSLQREIVRRYESSCFGECYIIRVLSIDREGEMKIPRGINICQANIDVMFTAECMRYNRGDVICDCMVQKVKEPGQEFILVCIANYADVCVLNNWKSSSVTAGQVIPVRVVDVTYRPNSRRIHVNAEVFVPSKEYRLYRCPVDIRNQSARLADLIERHSAALEKLAVLDEKLVEAFTLQLRAYDVPPKPAGIQLHLADIIAGNIPANVKFIAKPPSADSCDDVYTGFAQRPEDPSAQLIEHQQYDALCADILLEHIAAIGILESFVLLYADEKMRAEHENLWKLFRVSRKLSHDRLHGAH